MGLGQMGQGREGKYHTTCDWKSSNLSTNQKFRRRTMALYASKGYATPGGGGDGMGSFEEAENLSAYYNDDVREKDEICARDEGWLLCILTRNSKYTPFSAMQTSLIYLRMPTL
jgi:hypothetical protein